MPGFMGKRDSGKRQELGFTGQGRYQVPCAEQAGPPSSLTDWIME